MSMWVWVALAGVLIWFFLLRNKGTGPFTPRRPGT